MILTRRAGEGITGFVGVEDDEDKILQKNDKVLLHKISFLTLIK